MAIQGGTFNEGNALNRPPLFDGSNFNIWKKRMTIFIQSYDIEIWKVIVLGPKIPKKEDGSLKEYEDYIEDDWKMLHLNSRATQLLYCALNQEEHNRISSCENAKEIWQMLEVTHEGTTQVKETKINMLLHNYELFTMKDGESITNMLDRFAEITNGLASLGRSISSSDKVKKILRSLPREWDATVTAIMESKDLNTLEFSALIGSLINYEIVLKTRSSKAKPKEKNLAFKAKEISSDEEESDDEDENEQMAYYVKKYKFLRRRKKELNKPFKEESRNHSRKKNDDICYKCGKPGHFAKNCKSSYKSYHDKKKKKEVLVASWSDEDSETSSSDEEKVNLCLMARSNYSSEEESDDEVTNLSYDELLNVFNSLNDDFLDMLKLNKSLKKKNKVLELENETLKSKNINDHSSCILKQNELENELERLKKEFSYVVGKFTSGNEKFEKLLSLQKYSLSKSGLGCDPFERQSSLISKDNVKSTFSSICSRCLKFGHNEIACSSLRRTIKVKKIWVVKGTTLPNMIHVTNPKGPKVARVPIKKN